MGGIFPSMITKNEWIRWLLPLSKNKMVKLLCFTRERHGYKDTNKMHLQQFQAEYFQLILYI